MLRRYAKEGQEDLIQHFFTMLETHNLPLLPEYFTGIISGYASANKPGICWEYYEQMQESGIEPNSEVLFVLLVDTAGFSDQPEEKISCIQKEMKRCQLHPSYNFYVSTVEAYMRTGLISKAIEVFRDLEKENWTVKATGTFLSQLSTYQLPATLQAHQQNLSSKWRWYLFKSADVATPVEREEFKILLNHVESILKTNPLKKKGM